MKIGILKVDSVLPEFRNRHGDYPQMLVQILQLNSMQHKKKLQFKTFDVEKGDYPKHIDDFDGYIIPGSRKSVYDRDHWIEVLKKFVITLDAKKKKLVGVCFGHQLIAEVLGGKTERCDRGWGVGVHKIQIHNPPWFTQNHQKTCSLAVSHRDQVSTLPKRAELIASNKFCPHSMFSIEKHIFSMQGHPEFTSQYAMDLLKARREILDEPTYSNALESFSISTDRNAVAAWIVEFFFLKV